MRRFGETDIYRRYIATMTSAYYNRTDIRMFVEMLLTLIAIIVFTLFAIRPTLTTIGGLTSEISNKKETIQILDTKIEAITKAQEVLGAEQARIETLMQAVPTQATPTSFLAQIEKIVAKNEVRMVSANMKNIPLLENPIGEAQSIEYLISLEGDLPAILNAKNDIERMRRPSRFSTIGLATRETDDGSLTIVLSFSGNLPYLVKEETLEVSR